MGAPQKDTLRIKEHLRAVESHQELILRATKSH